MKMLIQFAFVCLFVVTIHCASVPKVWPAEQEHALEKCSAEQNIDLELARKILSHQAPAINEQDKCLMSCYMKDTNAMVNHKVNWENIYESHIAHITNTKLKQKMKEIFKKCEAKMTYEGKDDCQIAYDAYNCQ
ncbi:hypothetical protein O3M35_000864 [Rhynocoris fuscipes]|uniref:Uncharacterized protein n=1 Tax=Rhynocoris fuscipes TaxID=488301 RepID=A0AAW1DN79_9HEMI